MNSLGMVQNQVTPSRHIWPSKGSPFSCVRNLEQRYSRLNFMFLEPLEWVHPPQLPPRCLQKFVSKLRLRLWPSPNPSVIWRVNTRSAVNSFISKKIKQKFPYPKLLNLNRQIIKSYFTCPLRKAGCSNSSWFWYLSAIAPWEGA